MRGYQTLHLDINQSKGTFFIFMVYISNSQ